MPVLRRGPGAAGLLVLLASFGGACEGKIGQHGSAPTTTPTVRPLCSGLDPGPAFIRRVNRVEYNNTVRDLLGTSLAPGNSFPAEEKRLGFDDNAAALSVSPLLAEQYMLAAEQLAADAVDNHWSEQVPCAANATDVDGCGRDFIAAFGRRAFRRPLDADDSAILTAVFDAGKTTDLKTGIRLVITTVLQSPKFLYRVEQGRTPEAGAPKVMVKDAVSGAALGEVPVVRVDDWEMASRLSYLLWRSMPDDPLLAAAEAGQLSTDAEIADQAQRMLADPRARAVITDFHDQWLRFGEIDVVEKDASVYAGWTPSISGLMRQEARAFVDDVIWNGEGTLAALFGAPYTFANAALARYYGLPVPTDSGFVRVDLDPARSAGVLTQGGLLSLLAKPNQTSPVHRGKFVREQILCQPLQPPPANLQISPPELSATQTTRERFQQHSADDNCSSCHQLMDPIGFGFESFDGAGRYRETENGQPIDATGEVRSADVAGPFNGPAELGQKLAGSADVRTCVARQWFRYGYGRAETTADGCTVGTLEQRFAASGYKVLDLVAALAATDAFRYRRFSPDGGVQ